MGRPVSKKSPTKTPDKPQHIAEGHDKVASVVRIEDIYLSGCNSERRTDNLPEDLKLQDRHEIIVIEEKPVTKTFYVKHCFGIRGITLDQESEAEVHFLIEAEFYLTYHLAKRRGVKKADIESFAHINSGVHAWPYWREFVQTQSSRMGLPSVMVGILPPRKALANLVKERNEK